MKTSSARCAGITYTHLSHRKEGLWHAPQVKSTKFQQVTLLCFEFLENKSSSAKPLTSVSVMNTGKYSLPCFSIDQNLKITWYIFSNASFFHISVLFVDILSIFIGILLKINQNDRLWVVYHWKWARYQQIRQKCKKYAFQKIHQLFCRFTV